MEDKILQFKEKDFLHKMDLLKKELDDLKTENNYLRHKLDELGQDKLYRCESSRVDFMTIGRGFRVNIHYCCEGHEKDFKDKNGHKN